MIERLIRMLMQVRRTNAWIERDSDFDKLYSYSTLVCEVHHASKHVVLSPAARCSRTTIRHLSEFLKSYGISYAKAKSCLIDSTHETVEHDNGYTLYVSDDARFKFNPMLRY